MWGGRFERGPDAFFYNFQQSWSFDRRLLPHELRLDCAWASALEGAKILTPSEATEIIAAVDAIGQCAVGEPGWLDSSRAEDVHGFVEAALIEKLGPLGAKLHTGRSRNEMIATEFRMFVRDAASEMREAVVSLIEALATLAERNLGLPMPGHTHLQLAQPLLVAHWLLSHAEAFARDAARMESSAKSANVCPLGSGALAGCAFPIDRNRLAKELGFIAISANSLDAVSDRDFALEYLFSLSAYSSHLSRLAEDIVLFASAEFGFVTLPDEFSTGSSLMPQKKNPDAWELIRGKTGCIFGGLVSLFITLKGLPSSYQRDLQEDKEPLFAAHDEALAMSRVAAGAVTATKFNETRLRAAASDPALLATEAADYLVAHGVPFREAHEIVGQTIREAEGRGITILELPLETLKTFSGAFGADLASALTLESALARRRVPGGTAPETVRAALADLRARLGRREAAR